MSILAAGFRAAVAVFFISFLYSLQCPLANAVGLTELYQKAVKNDPSFRAIYFQKLATEESQRQALAQLLPVLSGSASYSYTSQDVRETENDVYLLGKTDYGTTSYGLTLRQPIFDWNLYMGLPQAKAEILWAEAGFVVANQALIIRMTDLYLQALAAKDQLEYAKKEQEAVAKHLELADEMLGSGLVSITDFYDAKARAATNQAITIEAENLLDDAIQALEEITGGTVSALDPLADELELWGPDPDNLESWLEATAQNPSIEMRKQAVEVARTEVSRQKAGHYPAVDILGRYNNEDSDDSIYGGGSEFDTFDVVLRLTVPFYQGGLVSSRVREAGYQLSAARQELEKQQRSVARETRSAFLGVSTALSQIEALDQSIEANQKALGVKQEGFLSGLFTSLNVLDADRDLSLIQIDYGRARYRYILNSLKLKAAVGTLSPQDLVDLEKWFLKS